MPKNVYEFVATGHADVIKAYESIGAAAQRQAKVAEAAARSTERSRGRAGGAGGSGGGRGQSAEDRRYKEAERAAARYERELANEVRATERAESRKRAVEARSAKARERQDAQVAARATRLEERAAQAREKREERARRHVAGIRERHFRDEQRREERLERVRGRASARLAAREASEKRRNREKSVETIKDLASGAVLGGAAAIVGTVAAATRESMALQESANRISINSRKSGEGFRSASAMRRGFERTALETKGIQSQDVADAVAKFISLTGDVDTASRGQGVFATVASATGAKVGDVAEATASLSQQFDIKSIDDMKEALAALSFQGKEGAFELKDAAAQFQRLAASGAAFGIPKGVQGVKTLGGLTQIARTGTGSAEQAATAVENLLTNLKVKQTQLKGAGVDVFDKNGKTRDVRDVITEAIAKVGGGDMARKSKGLSQIFGEQGIRAINPLIAKYSDTFRSTSGTEAEKTAAAMAMLREEFRKSIDAAGDWDDVLEDSAQAQQDSSAKLTAAWEEIKAGVGDKVIPALADLVTKLAGEDGATGLMDPFIDATRAAVEVLNLFADALYDTGLIKRKQKKSLAEQQADAEKELKKFDKKHGIGPLTAEDAAARGAIQDKIQKASDALWGTGPDAAPANMTPEEFARRYVEANPQNFSDAATGQDQALSMARRIQGGRGTAGTTESNDWFMQTFAGENQAQTDLRRRFQGQAQLDSQTTVTTEDIQKSLDAAAAAAERAAAAMGAMASANQGTIFAGQ